MAFAAWQATIVDGAGNAQAGATVTVRDEATGALAAIKSNRAGTSAMTNPATADAFGFLRFYVAGGSYRITATSGVFTNEWRHVGIGTASERDLPDEGDGGVAFDLRYFANGFTNGPIGEPNYTCDVWALGVNAASDGSPIVAGKSSMSWRWEARFFNADHFQHEIHLSHYPASGTISEHRLFSLAAPDDGAAGDAGLATQLDFFEFGTYAGGAGSLRMLWDFINKTYDILESGVIRFDVNNMPIMQQHNAAESEFLTLPYYGADNQLLLAGPISSSGDHMSGSGAHFELNPSGAVDTNSAVAVLAGSITGTYNGFFANATASVSHQIRLRNSHASGSAVAYLETGGGDAAITLAAAVDTPTWTFGLDNSDNDTFKLSASGALGTSDLISVTTAGAIALSAGVSLGFDGGATLVSGGTNNLSQRNGAGAQIARWYYSYTDASNGAWVELNTETANTFVFGSEGNGSGASTISKFVLHIAGSNRLDYNVTSSNKWTFGGNVGVAVGGQITIADSGVTHGLQLLGQSGADNIIGSLGASEPLVLRTNSAVRMRITDTLAVFGAAAAATSSFPGLKRSGTILQVRLGDDSAYGGLEAANIGAGGALSTTTFLNLAAGTTAASPLRFVQGAAPTSPVDGDMWREDNTNTGLKIRINGVTKTITVS